jgi:hypothetical protein
MSEQRAILVTREQRRALEMLRTYGPVIIGQLVAGDDAAGDRPRIRWCVEHCDAARVCDRNRRNWPHADYLPGVAPCRVVDAIVVPLEGEATR